MNTKELERLVALTFDSDPEVRKEAALKLGDQDDPIAGFALIELTTDKDKGVREIAKKLLEERKKKEPELLSFADIFEAGARKEEETPKKEPEASASAAALTAEDKRKKMLLSPIERMFEKKFGKERAEVVKKKLMPSIEKVYEKNTEGGKRKEEKREFLQQFINDYFTAVEEVEEGVTEKAERVEGHSVELEEIGFKETENIIYNPDEQAAPPSGDIEQALFNYFYNIAVEANGSAVVKHALYKDVKSKIDLAFSMIEKERKKVQSLSDLRKGMRSFTSEMLRITKLSKGTFKKSKRAEPQEYCRLEVEDEKGGSAVIYIFEKDVSTLREGMKIVVERAPVKEFNGENSIHISKAKGNLYIVV